LRAVGWGVWHPEVRGERLDNATGACKVKVQGGVACGGTGIKAVGQAFLCEEITREPDERGRVVCKRSGEEVVTSIVACAPKPITPFFFFLSALDIFSCRVCKMWSPLKGEGARNRTAGGGARR
jgi:hypothetical protein